MRAGLHVRMPKGLESAASEAERLGCECIQIFSGNPNSWQATGVNPDVARSFRETTSRLGVTPVVLHTPYLLNLASPKDDIWSLSRRALTAALDRAKVVGGQYIVTHIGSHGGTGFEAGAARVAESVTEAIDSSDSTAMVLLEGGAGSGNTIGSTIDQMKELLDRLEARRDRVAICLDTAHLWGAGYDLSTAENVESFLQVFDQMVGINRLKVFHLNDTLKELGSHIDRHWHIGKGKIGMEGFTALVNHPMLAGIAGILENPESELGHDKLNLERLKSLRK